MRAQPAGAWKLNIANQLTLLGVTRPTLYRWKQGYIHPLDEGVQYRQTHLFGIYAALQRLLPVPARANDWIASPMPRPSWLAVLRWTKRCTASWATCWWSGRTWTLNEAANRERLLG